MKFLFTNKKTLRSPLFIFFLSPFFSVYQGDLLSETVLKLNAIKKTDDQIIQVGLTFVNGYTGRCSIIISEDSIHFESDVNSHKLRFDTLTSKNLWVKIIALNSIEYMQKIKNGESLQDTDGTDIIFHIKTTHKKYYSVTNGHGEKSDKQHVLESLLTMQLFMCHKSSLANLSLTQ